MTPEMGRYSFIKASEKHALTANRTKLENVIHRIFGPAQLNIEIKDRLGQPVIPHEWFLVPLFVVDEAVDKIKNGTIPDYIYDPHTACPRRAGRDQTLA